ncbi:MAG: hypothetical protein FJZ01_14085 [Candidatus Sericytochromatia bacterium]|nr:hypothetical protein [Candidatus Tanganyikabacteria bacterium]
MFDHAERALKAWVGRMLALLAFFVLAGSGYALTGCNTELAPLALTSSVKFDMEQEGSITWTTESTQSPFFWFPAYAPTRMKLSNIRGSMMYIEGVQVFQTNSTATQSVTFPLRVFLCGVDGESGTGGNSCATEYSFTIPSMVDKFAIRGAPGNAVPGSAATEPKVYAFDVALLWRNSLGQRNYINGNFDTNCLCYPTQADEPVLDPDFEFVNTPKQRFGFVILYSTSGGT